MDFDLKKVEKYFPFQECLRYGLSVLIGMMITLYASISIALPGCGGVRGGQNTVLDVCGCNI